MCFVVVLLLLRTSDRCIFFRELVILSMGTRKHVIFLMLNFNIFIIPSLRCLRSMGDYLNEIFIVISSTFSVL